MADSNPFFEPSTLPYGLPPFAEIRDEHYLPAFERGMEQQLAEVQNITRRRDMPTFENTMVALEKSGRVLDRVAVVFFNKSSSDSTDFTNELEEKLAPLLAAHSDAIRLDSQLYWRIKTLYDQLDQLDDSPFEQLIGSLISARTRDETTLAVCLRLFEVARTPDAMAGLDESMLVALLKPAAFAKPKARDLHRTVEAASATSSAARRPTRSKGLTSLRGVGPKIAALTLAVGFGRPSIAVDIHVHRITNRWGYVSTSTPEKTMAALAAKLPERYWIEINERLVPFGKFLCVGTRPKCTICALLDRCAARSAWSTRADGRPQIESDWDAQAPRAGRDTGPRRPAQSSRRRFCAAGRATRASPSPNPQRSGRRLPSGIHTSRSRCRGRRWTRRRWPRRA